MKKSKRKLLHTFHILYEHAFEDGVNWERPYQHFSVNYFCQDDSAHNLMPPKECPRVYDAFNILNKN